MQRERVQRQHETTDSTALSEAVQSKLEQAVNRGGQPLDAVARSFLEPKFGHSFENVQIHADGEADMLSQDFGARAFTTGPNIFFRAGEFDPTSNDGLHLLAHELTHTVQQRLTSNRLDRAVSSKSDGAEGEARAAADAVMGGQAVSVMPSATAVVSREEDDSFLGNAWEFVTNNAVGSAYGQAVSGVADEIIGSTSGGIGTGIGNLVSRGARQLSGPGNALEASVESRLAASELTSNLLSPLGLISDGSGLIDNLTGTGSARDSSAGQRVYDGTSNALGFTSSVIGTGALTGQGLTAAGAILGETAVGSALTSVGGGISGALGAGTSAAAVGAAAGAGAGLLAAGAAGYKLGGYLSEETTVGEHSVDAVGGMDHALSNMLGYGEGESAVLALDEYRQEQWNQGGVGGYLKGTGALAGEAALGTAAALGGLAGGAVDAVGDAWDWLTD